MLKNPNIFVIVPAYNEAKNISLVLKELSLNYENIIVIDDASTDNTVKIVKKFPVILLQHKVNRGQGAALETGNQCALKNNADILVHFDADGQFLVSEIKELINPLINNNYDVVLGSRFLEKKSYIPWFKKNFIFPLARLINKTIFNIRLSDPQNGFRAFTRKVAQKIKIEQDGSAHCSEFLIKIFQNNFKIKEVAITVNYHEFGQGLFGGHGRGMGGIKILKDLFLRKLIK